MNHNSANFSKDLEHKLQRSNDVIKCAFEQYTANQIFLSFNGGKDCGVLLHLLKEFLGESLKEMKVIYFQQSDPFPEIEDFVKSCEPYYAIDIETLQIKKSMKDTLHKICDSDENIKACIMGSRRTDPFCQNLQDFQECDNGWPKLMRVNPLLEWNCSNIWEYLLKKKVPYCSLYDIGYTSIGNMKNTKKNPYLEDPDRPGCYRPAYELEDDTLERCGRF